MSGLSNSSKNQRWGFNCNLNKKTKWLENSMVSIKVDFEVAKLVEANHFGDVYMVTVGEPDVGKRSRSKNKPFSSDDQKKQKPKVFRSQDG